ncbi:MAG: signal peptidase II [Actinomycetota bacterium]|nr:signal peptidase II [Actinomycetota bacterium]MDA8315397.1 signal peptidase II [Actinomycetota bacterium]
MQERRAVATLIGARRRALLLTAAVAAAAIAADQATTSWALADLHHPVHLVGPLGLGLQYNSGTAFSLLDGAGDWLVPLVVVVLVGVGWLAWHAGRALLGVAYGLVLGGALGNLADRVLRGHHGDVVDFVTLSHWPTFNVADACITVGVVLAVLAMLFPIRLPPAPESGRGGTPEQRRDPDVHDVHDAGAWRAR